MPHSHKRGFAALVLLAALLVGAPSYARAPAHHGGRHIRHGALRHHRRPPFSGVTPYHPFGTIGRHARGRDAVAIAMRYVGASNSTGSGGRPWCGDFVNMTERLAGRRGLLSGALASTWRSYGHASAPMRGAIAVMRGHVSRVVAKIGSSVLLISGNWSHRVSVHLARLRDVLAFRTP